MSRRVVVRIRREKERAQAGHCVLLCTSRKTDAPPFQESVTRHEHGRARPRTSRRSAEREMVIASTPQPATLASFLASSSCTHVAFALAGAGEA